jgi:hypothetical protein
MAASIRWFDLFLTLSWTAYNFDFLLLFSNNLTPRCRIVLEKLAAIHLVKVLPALCNP